MNIKALTAFRAVVTEGSAAQAAQKINMSQPAVSRLIAILERELNLKLFYRTRRRLVLTREGGEFYKETERILYNLSQIPRIAEEIRERHFRSLSVVVMPRALDGWIAPALARFTADNPDIRLSVDERRITDLEQWIAGRHYDIGIGVLPIRHPDIETKPIFRARAEVLMHKKHRLAKRKGIEASDLDGENIIGPMPGLQPREQVDDIFKSVGIEPNYIIETSTYRVSCALVAEQAGITICDMITAAAVRNSETVLRPLNPPKWTTFGALWPRGTPPNSIAEALMTYLQEDASRMEIQNRLESTMP